MADEDQVKDKELTSEEAAAKEEADVREANEENVRRAARVNKLSELELREADIHPSGLNDNWETPKAGHETGLNMHDLSVEDQAKRRNLK